MGLPSIHEGHSPVGIFGFHGLEKPRLTTLKRFDGKRKVTTLLFRPSNLCPTGPTVLQVRHLSDVNPQILKNDVTEGRQKPRVRLQPQPMRALATPQPRVPEPSSRIRSSCGLETHGTNGWMKLIERTRTQQGPGLHSFWLKTW